MREGQGSVGGGVPMNSDVYAIVYSKTNANYPRNLQCIISIYSRVRILAFSYPHGGSSSLCKASQKAAVC